MQLIKILKTLNPLVIVATLLFTCANLRAATFTVTNTLDSGTGSLRQAIIDANASNGVDTITFNIGPIDGTVKTIFLTNNLTSITGPTVINGYSQPGSSSNTLATGNNAVLLIEVTATNNSQGFNITGGGCTVRGLVLNGFYDSGFQIGNAILIQAAATNNLIEGNFIGTDATGTNDSPRITFVGVNVNSPGNRIGGTLPGARNVIGGCINSGINLTGGAGTNNTVQGNYIGTDKTGTKAIANGTGIALDSSLNPIGGTTAGAGNLISGNTGAGIAITSASTNVVEGNIIGLNVTGSSALPNGNNGIFLNSANNTRIGGTTSGARNVISGNVNRGITMSGAVSNSVLGNFIGTDATGSNAVPNASGGIHMDLCVGAFIGGSAPGAGNVIAGNAGPGISFTRGSVLQIDGNFIGTDLTGTLDLGNGTHGIDCNSAVSKINVGVGAPNTIAFNGSGLFNAGVALSSGAISNNVTGNLIYSNTGPGVFLFQGASQTRISDNSIFDNGQLGILIGNALPNDPCDSDVGDNDLQNFPVITAVTSTVSSVTIDGFLNSAANTTFTLEFFANSVCDPSGFGEGKTFLGSTNVTTGANCTNNFTVTFPVAVPDGMVITATATDPFGNTSEFSACVTNQGAVTGCRGVAFFDEATDTIAISGQTVIGTACTYEAVLMFPSGCQRNGYVYGEHQVFGEDKLFEAGPNLLLGFNFPGGCCLQTNIAIATDVFHHVAFVYDGNEERFYLDGAMVASRVVGSFDVSDAANLGHIGAVFRSDAGVVPGFRGLLDSVRLSTVARYTGASFTPPASDMTSDANTVLLYNFNDGSSATNVVDESPLVRNGTFAADLNGTGTAPALLCLDDGIGFAPTITVSPALATNSVGIAHTVTATVKAGTNAVPGVIVNFEVTGANAGISGVSTTAANGSADFTYTGLVAGMDVIRATGTACLGLTGTVTKVWIGAPNQPPTAICRNVTTNANASCQATVTAAQVDNGSSDSDGSITNRTLNPPGPFAKGTNVVTLTVVDNQGASNSCTASIIVLDQTPPTISCPANIIANTSPGQCSRSNVTYTVTFGDNCPGATNTQTAGLASGATFPKGTTTNRFRVTDASGNTNTCSFTVTINDNQPPAITCPANIITTAALGQSNAVVNFTAPATDNCPGVTVNCLPPSGSAFPLGVTTVTCIATDTSGNTNSCSFTVTVNEAPTTGADLVLEKSASPASVSVGADLVYTLTVSNAGPDIATNVTLIDTFPALVSFVSAETDFGSCTQVENNVVCTLGSLAEGDTAQVTITVHPTSSGTICNYASAQSETADPVFSNNTASVCTVVTNPPTGADLSVTKIDSPDPVAVGSNLTYSIRVRNNGPQAATGVTLTDTLPDGVILVSAPTNCVLAGNVLTCAIGNLAKGASATETIVITATNTGEICNAASATGNETDPIAENNTDTACTQVTETAQPVHDMAVFKITAPTMINLNARVTSRTRFVTVQIQNRSPHNEVINSFTGFGTNLVTLFVDSLGVCPDLTPVLHDGPPQKKLPVTLKPKQKLNVFFDVTFTTNCVSDSVRDKKKDPGHADYRYRAVVHHQAIDGEMDTHTEDDFGPRSANPPFKTDPNPDGKIKDKGVGKLKPDKTFGADIVTDVTVK